MGATKTGVLKLSFDRRLALEFHGAKISSDAGLLAYREMDEVLGLTVMSGRMLNDWRTGKNTQHSMVALTRQSIYSRLAGYEDTNDAERLAVDPIMRQVVGGRATEHSAASTSQMARFETEVLTQPRNLAALANLSGVWIDGLRERRRLREVVLDMDSSVSETYGEQEGTAYNGHFGCTCYHPLFCFNQFGDVERSMLREGNVHSAKDWREVLEPVVARYRGRKLPCRFRATPHSPSRNSTGSWRPKDTTTPFASRATTCCNERSSPSDPARGPSVTCAPRPVCRLFLPSPELAQGPAGGRQG